MQQPLKNDRTSNFWTNSSTSQYSIGYISTPSTESIQKQKSSGKSDATARRGQMACVYTWLWVLAERASRPTALVGGKFYASAHKMRDGSVFLFFFSQPVTRSTWAASKRRPGQRRRSEPRRIHVRSKTPKGPTGRATASWGDSKSFFRRVAQVSQRHPEGNGCCNEPTTGGSSF